MIRYLTLQQGRDIAEAAIGAPAQVREPGLLDSALSRPRTTVFGERAYPDLFTQAAAMFQSLAANHPLIDGNKRLAWTSLVVFLLLNGVTIETHDDTAYDFVIAVASGRLTDVAQIADRVRSFSRSPAA